MKKIFGVIGILVLLSALAACGQKSTAASSGSSTTGTTGTDTTALSMELQLLVGTIKLQGTSMAVTADQTAQLLPCWQALLSLETSGTAASEEIDAVVGQIKTMMSTDQVSAITAMDLTRQDEIATMSSLGLSTNFSSTTTSTSATPDVMSGQIAAVDSGTSGGGAPSGSMPSGGAPSGDLSSGGQQDSTSSLSQSQITSIQSQGIQTTTLGSIDQVPQTLLEALITILQAKA